MFLAETVWHILPAVFIGDAMIAETTKKTKDIYGLLWSRGKNIFPLEGWHFNAMQKAVNELIVRGQIGIDVGSGCGYDTYIMAKHNPGVVIVSIDISDGIFSTAKMAPVFPNIKAMKGSLLEMPLKDVMFDFAYSYGVLHHLDNPQKGLLEIARILKKDAPCFLYVYEDHKDNAIKYAAVKIISILRRITVKTPPRILFILACAVSPFVFMLFSFSSKILMKFKKTQDVARRIPFNFGKDLFSLSNDLYDRFGAPVEHRFSKVHIYNMFMDAGFYSINILRMNDRAGWLALGYKR